ncbi:hypothetical protein BDP81DRAFT_425610 [Colletotrichum phormii]|uniref:Uncharacterized protein n=1 Tax=Colletotrichum phormii TaxID=359342 RepID=A0AAJ0EI20_9PEZI|nr:uncharacterized protein BDP81DRAFT_425610 [Colletotrichum phormii]KAK1637631.1 hypothetical protein BDP81DRAFT_425610 [Colletotrichum phormii]
MEFRGDYMPPNEPPLAWVLLWNWKYSNAYREYVPESLVPTGYVFWDAERLAQDGIKDFVVSQWETRPSVAEAMLVDRLWSPLRDERPTAEVLTDIGEKASGDAVNHSGEVEDAPQPTEDSRDASLVISEVHDFYLLHR